ncbi:MAG: hypothetical protein IJ466_12275 [Clostridia bacterium]|nr:hypothetical protein [Clostridia bacterium]
MKKDKQNTCPGCSRHCPLSAPRCKYGRTYLAKKQKSEAKCAKKESIKYKWEKYAARDGLAWKLFFTCRSAKRAMRDSGISEAQFFAVLTEEERRALAGILEKLMI